jgi:hypothetical protein
MLDEEIVDFAAWENQVSGDGPGYLLRRGEVKSTRDLARAASRKLDKLFQTPTPRGAMGRFSREKRDA